MYNTTTGQFFHTGSYGGGSGGSGGGDTVDLHFSASEGTGFSFANSSTASFTSGSGTGLTVTAGSNNNIEFNLVNVLSSSAQIATDISGAIDAATGSLITGIIVKEDNGIVSGGPFTTLDFNQGTVTDDSNGEAKIRFTLSNVTDAGNETGNGATFFRGKSGNGYRYGLNLSLDKDATSGFESDGNLAKTHITPQHTTKPFYFIGSSNTGTQQGDIEEYPNNFVVFNKNFYFTPGNDGPFEDGPVRPGINVNGYLQLQRYTSGTGSQDPRSGVLITSNPNIYFFNSDSSGSVSGSLQISSASAQIKFDTGSSALKVFAGSTNEDLLEVMHISRSGANPRVGIGTNNPLKAFDFKSVSDDDRGGELLIRGSRTTKGADINDEVGRINFSIDSSSFSDITTSGSAAEIVALVDEVDTTGVKGHLSFRIANAKTGAPAEIFKLSGSKSILNSPLDVGTLTPGLSDINASTINRYSNTSTRIELASNHLEFYGNAYGLKISNTGIDANPGGLASLDFKVRSDNDEKAIFVDAGLDSIQLGSNTNTHITASGNVSSSAASTASFGSLKIDGASVDFSNLPTSDPGVAGRLWNDSNTLKISAG